MYRSVINLVQMQIKNNTIKILQLILHFGSYLNHIVFHLIRAEFLQK